MRARLLALLVHGVTAALVAGAVLLWLSPVWVGFRVVGAVLLLGLAWQVRPRPVAMPDGAVLDRRSAPALFALLDEIATAGAAPVPARVVLDRFPRATSGRAGGGTFVAVGLPLWTTAPPAARVALLAEQLGRLGSGASVVDPLVVSAHQTLTDWRYFFKPSREEADRRIEVMELHFVMSHEPLGTFTDLVLPVLLAPLYLLVSGLRRLLVRLAQQDIAAAQRRGREVAERVAGHAAVVDLDRLGAVADAALVAMETASRRDPKADLWSLGESKALSGAGSVDALVRLTNDGWAAVEAEVRGVAGPVAQALRDAARS